MSAGLRSVTTSLGRDTNGRPTESIVVGGCHLNFIVDTRAAISIIHVKDPRSSGLASGKTKILSTFVNYQVMAMLSKSIEVQIGHQHKTHVFTLLTLPYPKGNLLGSDFLGRQECVIDLANQSLCLTAGQELGCPLVVMLECGMVIPAEGPDPDEYHLDTLIAKHTLYPELQAILRKHADAFAKHKHDCRCMAVTIVVDGGDVPTQKQYSYPDQATSYIAKAIK
ncbi:unnamed protein product [Caretta caretta]